MAMDRLGSLGSRQIKAARALLDWSQDDLAGVADLSIATIRKLELGDISPRRKTTQRVRQAFEDAGLEFIDPAGVRQRPEEIIVYQGDEGIRIFFDDVYHTASRKGGEMVMVYASEDPFCEAMGDYDAFYLQRMESIKDKISVKCILTENTENLCSSAYSSYRTISKRYIDSVPFYIYDDKYAIILFEANPSPKIIVIQSRLIADAFKRQFYSMWEKATPLSTKKLEQTPLHKRKAGSR
jgi:transcriptional regulator with XRE-family HTH domain